MNGWGAKANFLSVDLAFQAERTAWLAVPAYCFASRV